MKAYRATFPLAAMCRVLGLSPSGYYDWLRRPPSARARRDAELKGRIVAHWIESGETYGCPRIHAALLAEGHRVSRKRVARLMRELGIEGVTRRRFKTGTTKRDASAKAAPDLVNRDFSAAGPDRLWIGRHHAGSHGNGLAVPRRGARCVEPADRRLGDGAPDAGRPGGRRAGDGDHPPPAEGTGHPSQRPGLAVHVAGVWASGAARRASCSRWARSATRTTTRCARASSRRSSANSSDRRYFPTMAGARRGVFSFIEGFYNTRRLHSALGYKSPANFEKLNHAA